MKKTIIKFYQLIRFLIMCAFGFYIGGLLGKLIVKVLIHIGVVDDLIWLIKIIW